MTPLTGLSESVSRARNHHGGYQLTPQGALESKIVWLAKVPPHQHPFPSDDLIPIQVNWPRVLAYPKIPSNEAQWPNNTKATLEPTSRIENQDGGH
ncbi:hypothetical protein JTE90_000691 [Oedothorax gibbosus]|uniref:Uncharacterized protein n=1 Tax=Oedothorax gibbosus TaxID=931172 RepID=A0AAV6TYY6_9ARAC|nr:hypothetical protein JTE90_000691 [Oedothorax gibbosus]